MLLVLSYEQQVAGQSGQETHGAILTEATPEGGLVVTRKRGAFTNHQPARHRYIGYCCLGQLQPASKPLPNGGSMLIAVIDLTKGARRLPTRCGQSQHSARMITMRLPPEM